MHSPLFVTEIPKDDDKWRLFVDGVKHKIKNVEGVLRLGENVWLLNLQKSVASLGWLIGHAEGQGIAYGLLPFENAPQWLPGGFDPKTIQDRSVNS